MSQHFIEKESNAFTVGTLKRGDQAAQFGVHALACHVSEPREPLPTKKTFDALHPYCYSAFVNANLNLLLSQALLLCSAADGF